jgi:hypothetical protein
VEYDVVYTLRSAANVPDHDTDVSGYIIVIGGTPWSAATDATPLVFSLSTPALYSAPVFGPLAFGPSPDG